MKKYILSIVSGLSALVMTSCFQDETTVHVKKDGSGTIVVDRLVSDEMIQMMGVVKDSFEEPFRKAAADLSEKHDEKIELESKPLDLFSEDKARESAANYGEGVTLVKIEPVNRGSMKGARATYRFTDINKLRIPITPSTTPPSQPGNEKPAKKAEKLTFTYKDGMLTILKPEESEVDDGKPAAEEEAPKEPSAEEIAGMKEMLGELKFSVRVVAEDGIAETNATHREGNTITLREFDMAKFMEKPENFKYISPTSGENPGLSVPEANIDGVKDESKTEITVKLK